MAKKSKPLNWSRDYFSKNDDGKYECNFGCGTKYSSDKVDKFQKHLLEQCKKIGTEARAEINRKAGIQEGTPAKRPRLDDLLITPNSSSSAPNTPKASTSFGLGNFIDRMGSKEQDELDVLLTRILAEVAQFKAQSGDFDKEHWGWEALNSGDLDAKTFWAGCFPNTILAKVFQMLQIIPITSAATERNWSIRSAIHTKVRNRLAVEMASKLTSIKHNLILEHPNLFKIRRQQETEAPDDEILDEIAADDIIIEDC